MWMAWWIAIANYHSAPCLTEKPPAAKRLDMSNPLLAIGFHVTPEEYLAAEEMSETKHEYLAGAVLDRPYDGRAHNQIATNIAGELWHQLRDTPCVTFGSNQRVRILNQGMTFYYYPDVTVDCSGSREDQVVAPTVLFEVLSPRTDRADRGDKLLNYQSIPSLRVYVLVEQARYALTVYRRGENGVWSMEVVGDPRGSLELPEIGCSLPLAEIYDRVLPPG